MLARHKRYVGEGAHAVHGRNVAQLNERVPPITGLKHIAHEVREPLALENLHCRIVLFPVLGFQHEFLLQGLAVPLADAAREVQVDQRVGVAVVKSAALGVLDIERHLPCLPPCRNIFLRETCRNLVELDEDASLLLGGFGRAGGSHQGLVCA